MKNDYISVSEFSRRAGVTKQSVYQRIQGGLKKYVKDLNGKKVIHIKALHDVYGVDLEQGLEQDLNKDSQGQNAIEMAVIEMLRAELDAKNEQLRERDKQVASLTAALEHTTQALHAAQALHAGTIKAQLGPGVDQSQEPEPVITVEDPPSAPEPKRHWWQRRRDT